MTARRSQPNQPKRKPLGDPLEWNDTDLDHLSHITPADLKAAAALWQNEAPAGLKTLLQAEVQEEGTAHEPQPA